MPALNSIAMTADKWGPPENAGAPGFEVTPYQMHSHRFVAHSAHLSGAYCALTESQAGDDKFAQSPFATTYPSFVKPR
jgi:hypothetical protein